MILLNSSNGVVRIFNVIYWVLILHIVVTVGGSSGSLLSQYDLLLLPKPQPITHQNATINNTIILIDLSTKTNKTITLHSNVSSSCGQYDSLIPGDTETDLAYFTCGLGGLDSQNENLIGEINLVTLQVRVLYRLNGSMTNNKPQIKDLNYSNKTLYWIENENTIKSIQTANNSIATVVSMSDNKITSITITNNSVYYTVLNSRVNSSIMMLDLNSQDTVTIVTNLMLPTSINTAYDGSGLYVVSNPPGIYFYIHKIVSSRDSNGSVSYSNEVVAKEVNNHGDYVFSNCYGVYWVDVVGRVWRVVSGRASSDLVRLGSSDLRVSSVRSVARGCSYADEGVVESGGVEKLVVGKDIRESDGKVIKSSSIVSSPSLENSGLGGVRLCGLEEVKTLNCDLERDVCVVLGSVPSCLSTTSKNLQEQPHDEPSPLELPVYYEHHKTYEFNDTSVLPSFIIVVISVLATTTTCLFVGLVVVVVKYRGLVRKRGLDSRPRIRRRIVRRSSEGAGHGGGGSSVCEMIDIENCCNMNVCETPCYERTLLPSSANSNNGVTESSHHHQVVNVNSSNGGWSVDNSGGCGDKKCLVSI